MKVYCDLTTEQRCIGILPGPDTELILTGTEVHTEPEQYRDIPLARELEECCDVRFFFGKELQAAPFCTVPRSVVFARDSRGGYFVSGEAPAMDWSAPVYYIDSGRNCYRLIPAGERLADMGILWRQTMVPTDEIGIFPDRAAAERIYPIRTLQELMEESI